MPKQSPRKPADEREDALFRQATEADEPGAERQPKSPLGAGAGALATRDALGEVDEGDLSPGQRRRSGQGVTERK